MIITVEVITPKGAETKDRSSEFFTNYSLGYDNNSPLWVLNLNQKDPLEGIQGIVCDLDHTLIPWSGALNRRMLQAFNEGLSREGVGYAPIETLDTSLKKGMATDFLTGASMVLDVNQTPVWGRSHGEWNELTSAQQIDWHSGNQRTADYAYQVLDAMIYTSLVNSGEISPSVGEWYHMREIIDLQHRNGAFKPDVLREPLEYANRERLPGIFQALEYLVEAGKEVIIVTDNAPEDARRLLDAVEYGGRRLADYTDAVYAKRGIKPEIFRPGNFATIEKEQGVTFANSIYIGDNTHKDGISPMVKSGERMRSILVDPSFWKGPDSQAFFTDKMRTQPSYLAGQMEKYISGYAEDFSALACTDVRQI